MFTKHKYSSREKRQIIIETLAVLGMFVGAFLFLDGFIFHWMGDISHLDPTGSDLIHHWHLGIVVFIISAFLLYVNRE